MTDDAASSTPDEEVVATKSILNSNNGNPVSEALISTAVHFLQNPKVKNVPLAQKRAFLIKKGLTNEHVDQAFKICDEREPTPSSGGHNITQYNQPAVPYPPGALVPYQQQLANRSLWYRYRELCTSLMVIGATCYGLYYTFKKYVEPLIIGKQRQEEDRMTKMERHLMELNRSLSQLRHSLVCVESALNKKDGAIVAETVTTVANANCALDIVDLKAEVSSIKSLLLSRKQFPVAPLSSLSIPTWQLKNDEEQNGEKIEENNGDDLSEEPSSKEEDETAETIFG